ncbi:sensor domain-containing diguanylate cyclase [Pseudobacillus badius]|uniref:sensor domain-containing diguanylate cyclase n=1 Tax=Bacillus badius TaxID=1455 RepID=UPI0007B0621F|nr:sensor domain-containing diguanylate cyclase [Bacillus badius]KZN98331.1 PAS domain S-box protein [Bacillus badius]OCS82701.1 PAS domain S-box protein [Bacillus badius]OVE51407.1 PAS domain S-box protein [Bacillus badius]TDW02511.1 PAS domain S-box-containing protein/diguanylate cyclase (GGDEF)-like protein [Bacillus badius]UAT30693.1 sensor domain-containing diguanylate cyclase [Bacillus badius]
MDERLNHAPCGYVSITNRGIITAVNETFLNMFGYDRKDVLDHHIESMMSMANKFLFHTYFYPFIQLYGYVNEMYLTLKSKQGDSIPVLVNGRSRRGDEEEIIDCVFVQMSKRIDYEKEIRNAKATIEEAYRLKDEALGRLEVLHRDIELKQTELIRLNAELEKLAVTDALTGLKNRRYFIEKLDAYMERFAASHMLFSVLILDVDHFKNINDTQGHLVGDQVLRKLAQIMEASLEEPALAARYGGEEFIVLLPGMDACQSKQAAEDLRTAIEQDSWGECAVTVSIGAATVTSEDTNISILARADQALYQSKNNGRNCVTHAADGLHHK